MYGYSTSMFLINSFVYSSAPTVETEFKITVDTTQAGSASDTFVLPLQNTTNNFTIYWGDGTSETVTSVTSVTHVYASSGTYQISLDGSFDGIRFIGGGDRLKLSSIDNWGANQWKKLDYSFRGCTNVVGTYTDSPDTSLATGIATMMFRDCTNFNSPLTMDTSGITSMTSMFRGCTNFNGDVTFSDTSSVTNMSYMFNACANFDKAVNFDTSNVTAVRDMFNGCTNFNKPVNFNTVKVTDTVRMFGYCSSFNQTINFDLSAVSITTLMFVACTSFNSPVTFTNGSGVTSFSNLFNGCTVFDQDISGFNITSITTAVNMLVGTAFSTTNYDLLLVGWQGQSHNNSVALHAGTAQYSSGAPATARAGLISDSWTITDGGAV